MKLDSPALRWTCVLAWFGLVLVLMLTPGLEVPYDLFGDLTDKVGHLALFGIFAGLLYWALLTRLAPPGAFRVALGVALVVGTGTELAQALVPGREVAFFDFVANWLGTMLGAALAAWKLSAAPR